MRRTTDLDTSKQPPPNRRDGPATPRVRASVLAGVHAWDEQSLDVILPRCLLPVALSPVICYVLRWLSDGGVTDATICANSASRCARQCLADGAHLGMKLDYYEDWMPRGPAGCVRDAGVHTDADLFIVAESSVIPLFPLAELLRRHLDSGATLTVVLTKDRRPKPPGNGNLRPAGLYIFDRRALEHVPEVSYQDIKEVLLPKLRREDEPVVPYVTDQPVPRVSGFESYLAVNEYMVDQLCRGEQALPGYRRIGESLVHSSGRVGPGVNLIGPSLIGPETQIEPGATVVGPAAIGAGCRVDSQALVSRSVIWDGCRISTASAVYRSVLPSRTVLADGGRVNHTLLTSGRRASERVLPNLAALQPLEGADLPPARPDAARQGEEARRPPDDLEIPAAGHDAAQAT